VAYHLSLIPIIKISFFFSIVAPHRILRYRTVCPGARYRISYAGRVPSKSDDHHDAIWKGTTGTVYKYRNSIVNSSLTDDKTWSETLNPNP